MAENLRETDASLFYESSEELETEASAEEEETTVDEDEVDDESQETGTDAEESEEVLDLDGEEVTLEQIKEWKQGYLRQSDYSKKTEAIAEKVKAEVAEKGKALIAELDKQSKVTEQLLVVMDAQEKALADEEASIDWDDLDEQGLSSKTQREIDKRRKAIKDSKAMALKSVEQAKKAKLAQQGSVLVELKPEWSDTKVFQDDWKMISEYLLSKGFSDDDISMTAKNMLVYYEAAKASQKPKKDPAKKRVKSKTIKGGKPKPAAKKDAVALFYGDN